MLFQVVGTFVVVLAAAVRGEEVGEYNHEAYIVELAVAETVDHIVQTEFALEGEMLVD